MEIVKAFFIICGILAIAGIGMYLFALSIDGLNDLIDKCRAMFRRARKIAP